MAEVSFYISDRIKTNVVNPNIVHNIKSDEMMDKILHYTKTEETELDDYFTKDGLLCVNKNCKEGNYYAFDKYGIIIRRKEYNNVKNVYGWIYNDAKEPISIHIDKYLMQTATDDKIFSLTMSKLKHKYPSILNTNSIYTRVANNTGRKF